MPQNFMMKRRRIRLKSFLLIIVCFSFMTVFCLNVLSSFPTEESAAPKFPNGGEALRSTRHPTDELHWGMRSSKSRTILTPFLDSLYPIGRSLLRQLPYNFLEIFRQRSPPCRKRRLWPTGLNETEDRILNQLNYTLPRSAKHKPASMDTKAFLTGDVKIPEELKNTELKTILAVGGMGRAKRGRQQFLDDKCPVNTCYLTDNHSYGPMAKAVLFQNHIAIPNFKRPLNQIWIIFLLESPLNTQSFGSYKNLVNMTATYRRDSTIVAPYERFVPYKNASQYQLLPPKRNYASGKTKKIAWFVSNCGGRNNRMGYALELSKYIEVDIYGPCGKLKCPRSQSKKCFDKLNTDYKFYLAFENSNCKDYITEKLFWNGFLNDVVPIVMGARPEDYQRSAPPNSYIHVDQFDSPKDLANFLLKLDKNDELYSNYFRWKGSGSFINTKFYCRVCAMIHDNTRLAWYEDLNNWWRGEGICVTPSGNNKYASWRKSKYSYYNMSDPNISKTFSPHYVHIPANISHSMPSEC